MWHNTGSYPHTSLKLAGRRRHFCFSSSENFKTPLQSTRLLYQVISLFDYRKLSCTCTYLQCSLELSGWSDSSCLCLVCILCACELVYTCCYRYSVYQKHWFMSRKGIQAYVNKPGGNSSFKMSFTRVLFHLHLNVAFWLIETEYFPCLLSQRVMGPLHLDLSSIQSVWNLIFISK